MTVISPLSVIRLAVYLKDETVQSSVREIVGDDSMVQCDARIGSVHDVDDGLLAGGGTDVLLVDVDIDDRAEMRALERLVASGPSSVPIIVATLHPSVDGMRRLMHLGIADVVPLPVRRTDLLAALKAVRHRIASSAQAEPERRGLVLPVLKGGGGSGATTVALHMAWAFSRQRGKQADAAATTCVIDLDIQFGSVGLYLDLDPNLTVLDVLEAGRRLDGELLGSAATRHRSGLDVLPASAEITPLEMVTPEAALRLADVAARHYAQVVVDMPTVWNAWSRAVLEAADAIILVIQLTVAGVHNACRQLETLRQEGLDGVPVIIVVNRCDLGLFASKTMLREAEKALGCKLQHFIPSDFRSVQRAMDDGALLPEVGLGKAVLKRVDVLARAVTELAMPASADGKDA